MTYEARSRALRERATPAPWTDEGCLVTEPYSETEGRGATIAQVHSQANEHDVARICFLVNNTEKVEAVIEAARRDHGFDFMEQTDCCDGTFCTHGPPSEYPMCKCGDPLDECVVGAALRALDEGVSE